MFGMCMTMLNAQFVSTHLIDGLHRTEMLSFRYRIKSAPKSYLSTEHCSVLQHILCAVHMHLLGETYLKLLLRHHQQLMAALHIRTLRKVMCYFQRFWEGSAASIQDKYTHNGSPVHQLNLFGQKENKQTEKLNRSLVRDTMLEPRSHPLRPGDLYSVATETLPKTIQQLKGIWTELVHVKQ